MSLALIDSAFLILFDAPNIHLSRPHGARVRYPFSYVNSVSLALAHEETDDHLEQRPPQVRGSAFDASEC